MAKDFRRSIFINTLWSTAGRVCYLLIGLGTSVILVRLLGPEEFGQVGIVMFFIAVASVLAESGLSGALVRKQSAAEDDYSTIFIFNMVVSLFFMIILMALSGFIADYFGDSDLKIILIVSSIILVVNALRVTQSVRLIKELQFKRNAAYEIVAIVVASIVAIFLAFNNAGVWALVAFQLSTAVVLSALMWVFVGPLKSYRFNKVSFNEFYRFGVNTTLSSLLNTAFSNIYQVILGKYFSIAQVGYFYQAKKLQEMPISVMESTTSSVIYSALSKLQNDPNEFNKLYRSIIRVFTIFVALVCVIVFYYSELIVNSLYGDKWVASIFYLQLLIVASYFYMQEMFNRIIFKIFDRTEKILQLEVFKKFIQAITIIYGVSVMSINALLYGYVAISIVSYMVNYHVARKVQNYFSWDDFFQPIKVFAIAAATVFISGYIDGVLDLTGLELTVMLPILLLIFVSLLHLFNVSNPYKDILHAKSIISRDG